MFEFCTDPKSLETFQWFSCYLTTPKHMSMYYSLFTVVALILLTAPFGLMFGFMGAFASRSKNMIIRILGKGYTSIVRGVPDIVFFLFVPIALDQAIEFIRHKTLCWDVTEPIWRGNDFVVCRAAKMPLSEAAVWTHDVYGFLLAVVAFAFVFGAFCSNVLAGALKSVPRGQIEAGRSMGLGERQIRRLIEVPQMWIYALPGLSNLWQLLIKSTPLLFLLGVEDLVYWARELGGSKTSAYAYSHADWRLAYFTVLLLFYLLVTSISQRGFERMRKRLARGQNFSGAS
ncbi:ABC transporter permease [Amylibacter kogurei]|uniref:ABC transporter permease n=1 Tax=Paramylibacter kogurei TaxID=1889778 RepID=A0A2G5K597_9RHOB|nr:ABC transporter permease subunit [Amylibacter kogurei]PIB24595.1 ABC transporter permease [Amylibacter kogurei]